MQTGNISVHTQNIFPIIKKFLYTDHDIFIRELVSNAVDASQKLNEFFPNTEPIIDSNIGSRFFDGYKYIVRKFIFFIK